MKFFVAAIVIALSASSSAQNDPGCDVKFTPEAVKPKTLDSVRAVLASFIPTAESKRLSDLRLVVMDLAKKKAEFVETLHLVSNANSLQDWQKAKLQQIPELQRAIVSLFWKMRAEYNEGGLFAGNKAFADLGTVVQGKKAQLNEACLLTYSKLPLVGEDKKKLDTLISNIDVEIDLLHKIDDQLSELIRKAQEKQKQ